MVRAILSRFSILYVVASMHKSFPRLETSATMLVLDFLMLAQR